MACFHPMQAYRSKFFTKNGKRDITFSLNDAFWPELPHNRLKLPCGQCIGCRSSRSSQWATRIMHEAHYSPDNCFLTLTFDDDHLQKREFPESLDVKDVQKFMKRLRKKFGNGIFYGFNNSQFIARNRIRFFQSGEYGSQFGRPHYHVILFNCDFPDKYFFKYSPSGEKLYRSNILESLWPFGHSSIGSLTFQSAQYVAKYITLKHTGKDVGLHYAWDLDIDEDTGELCVLSTLKPEFSTMSRRPGIGKDWFDEFNRDLVINDEVILDARSLPIPAYYMKQFELTYPSDFARIKKSRLESIAKHAHNNTPERLAVREYIRSRSLSKFPRGLIYT